MKEKGFRFGGFSLKVGTDARRAERIKKNPMFRYLVRPGLNFISHRENGHGRVAMDNLATQTHPGRQVGAGDPETWKKVSSIGWYHTIDLGNGIVTPGFIDNRHTVRKFGLPDDMSGMRCLDIGTYDGFWAFEMERRGASEVVGIDVDSPLDHDIPLPARRRAMEAIGRHDEVAREQWTQAQAQRGLQYPGEGFRLAAEILGSKAKRENLSIYDLSPERLGMFDVVLISQLLLRLRDPQTAIENMFSVTRGFAIVAEPFDPDLESLSRPVSEFVGTSYIGIWWRHSAKSMARMMETAGFSPVEEVSRFETSNREGKFTKVVLKGYVPGEHDSRQVGA
jgi:tRNA (mo5U34)-methyltransferase